MTRDEQQVILFKQAREEALMRGKHFNGYLQEEYPYPLREEPVSAPATRPVPAPLSKPPEKLLQTRQAWRDAEQARGGSRCDKNRKIALMQVGAKR